MRILLVFCCLILGGSNFLFSQTAYNQAFFQKFYKQKSDSLNQIEGFYEVTIRSKQPLHNCPNCEYAHFEIRYFDQIAIAYMNGNFEIYSVKTNEKLGIIKSTMGREQVFSLSNVYFEMRHKNYPNSEFPASRYESSERIHQYVNVDSKELTKLYDDDHSKLFFIHCTDGHSGEFCTDFEYEIEYAKIKVLEFKAEKIVQLPQEKK